MQNSIAVGDTVYIKPGAVYGGSYPSRGAAVPAYMGGYRRYTVGRITHRHGADEAFLSEINSWVALQHLRVILYPAGTRGFCRRRPENFSQ